ncbi:hypothetical protein HHI36_007229 [Cryptolaemus montrouzieri]|uniref:Histone-lysine N-methyltransferase, H3 lysine-36 and H4 lysine-20 specific n=1 Tax=Cryptolaemus montrouzieri TaxID=559131 RepID=A0ABD2MP11_9CUCU
MNKETHELQEMKECMSEQQTEERNIQNEESHAQSESMKKNEFTSELQTKEMDAPNVKIQEKNEKCIYEKEESNILKEDSYAQNKPNDLYDCVSQQQITVQIEHVCVQNELKSNNECISEQQKEKIPDEETDNQQELEDNMKCVSEQQMEETNIVNEQSHLPNKTQDMEFEQLVEETEILNRGTYAQLKEINIEQQRDETNDLDGGTHPHQIVDKCVSEQKRRERDILKGETHLWPKLDWDEAQEKQLDELVTLEKVAECTSTEEIVPLSKQIKETNVISESTSFKLTYTKGSDSADADDSGHELKDCKEENMDKKDVEKVTDEQVNSCLRENSNTYHSDFTSEKKGDDQSLKDEMEDHTQSKTASDAFIDTKLENTKQIENSENNLVIYYDNENKIEDELKYEKISKKQDIFEYLDVGYDIHRRTSFRKILERVMELSKNEIKTKELETSRLQRCKSVPHEDFYSEKEMISNPQSLSVDNKYKYLNEKTTLIENMDQSRIKRRLSYSFGTDRSCRRNRTKSVHVTRVDLDSKRLHEMKNIGRSKSVLGESFDVYYDVDANEKIDIKKKRKRSNSGSNVHGSNESIREDKSEFYKKNTEVQSINKAGTSKNDNLVHKEMYDKPESQQIVNSELKSYQKSFEEEVDLEVERLQSGNYSTKRTRCYSEGANVQTDATEGLVRSKSVFGRSRKMSRRSNGRPRKKSRSKWRREIAGFEKMAEGETHSKASKKVYEFKIGDSVWGKVGAYPYWPCLIMSDPITSEFKKYKLLRTTPYYHVRFFGDKGKRSWTTHVIPYETPDDLEMLAKISCREGIQMSVIKECYFVKPKQMNKWKQAVAEAESIKNESVETKLEFFNKIFSIGINPQFDVAVDKNKSVPNEDENDERDSSSLNSKKNIKKSSVLSSIEAVVARCSEEEDDSDQISSKKHSTPKMERGRQRKKTENGDFDLGLELLHLPPIDSVSAPAYTPERSPLGKSTTPTDITVPSIKRNPQRRKSSPNIIADVLETLQRKRGKSRSRSSSRINMSSGNKEEIKADFQSPPQEIKPIWSPPKLREKKQAQQVDQSDCESKASDNSFKNIHVSQLSQWKKNLFRGITKEKVCQICEMPGDVIKCRGPCNGDYHIRCVEDSLKFTEDQNLEMKKVEKAGTEQVQIITVGSRKKLLPANIALSPSNRQMPISDQIDRKMKEIMNQAYEQTESTDSSGEEMTCDKLKYELPVKIASSAGKSQKGKGVFKHVTADDVSIIHITDEGTMERRSVQNENETAPIDECVYKCPFCTSSVIPPCFVCNAVVSKKGNSMRQRCSLQKCGRFYHLECLNIWPQTQWSFILHEKRKTEAFDSFVCPRHVCHICASDNLGFSIGRCPNDKLVKCLRCPATYHNSHHCVPAGTQILTSTQIICPRHLQGNKKPITSNTVWCFVCSEGGNLICCETCPTSVHSECLQVNLMDDDTYICEDCESGRFPLYDEVVWVKCGKFRWWPATILFPSEVPLNVEAKAHNKGDFVVKFFGTYDYYWVGRGRTFLYQEGDTGCLNSCKNRIDEAFSRALKEAAEVYHLKKESKSKRDKEVNNGLKPPPYVKIKVNRPVGNVRVFEGNLSNTTSCDCNPEDVNPCGPNSNCLNRILLTECNPEICPAEQRCKNQCFEKREYPQMIPYRTPSRGWGLKTLEPLVKGQFIIEYVGEIIDDEEYQRRIKKMHEQKDENYYFLTIDNNRMLDAGPKGNAARFMNHSCQPNCETQKWTVNGDTRVGLFALEDIPENTELTFNYNLECVGTEKKICRCGAPNCSGFIGLKPEDQRPPKRSRVEKKKEPEPHQQVIEEYPCFVCGKDGGVRICTNKSCSKSYHLKCVQLESLPEGKWNCPSHSCNICSRRTTRSCTKCINSFCPSHSEGQIRYDNVLGYICKQHDPTRERKSKITSKETLECSSSRKNLKAKSTPSLLKGKSRKRQRDSDISDKFSSKRLKINSN